MTTHETLVGNTKATEEIVRFALSAASQAQNLNDMLDRGREAFDSPAVAESIGDIIDDLRRAIRNAQALLVDDAGE